MKRWRLAILALLALTASAADVTGKWSGTSTVTGAAGTSAHGSIYLALKQDGEKLTGSVGIGQADQ
jgi:hypothetical protein